MYEQDFKVRKNVGDSFIIRNSQRQVILHIVITEIYTFLKDVSGGHFRFMHKQDLKITK